MAEKITAENMQYWNLSKFDDAINIVQGYINDEKKLPPKEQDKDLINTWTKAVADLKKSKSTLEVSVNELERRKNIENDVVKELFDSEKWTRETVNLVEANAILGRNRTIDDVSLNNNPETMSGVVGNKLKDKFFTNKNGSMGIGKACFGIGVAAFASEAITGVLASAGIGTQMGLIGLATTALPSMLTGLTSALTGLVTFSPTGAIMIGAALAFKVIPLVKQKVIDYKNKKIALQQKQDRASDLHYNISKKLYGNQFGAENSNANTNTGSTNANTSANKANTNTGNDNTNEIPGLFDNFKLPTNPHVEIDKLYNEARESMAKLAEAMKQANENAPKKYEETDSYETRVHHNENGEALSDENNEQVYKSLEELEQDKTNAEKNQADALVINSYITKLKKIETALKTEMDNIAEAHTDIKDAKTDAKVSFEVIEGIMNEFLTEMFKEMENGANCLKEVDAIYKEYFAELEQTLQEAKENAANSNSSNNSSNDTNANSEDQNKSNNNEDSPKPKAGIEVFNEIVSNLQKLDAKASNAMLGAEAQQEAIDEYNRQATNLTFAFNTLTPEQKKQKEGIMSIWANRHKSKTAATKVSTSAQDTPATQKVKMNAQEFVDKLSKTGNDYLNTGDVKGFFVDDSGKRIKKETKNEEFNQFRNAAHIDRERLAQRLGLTPEELQDADINLALVTLDTIFNAKTNGQAKNQDVKSALKRNETMKAAMEAYDKQ